MKKMHLKWKAYPWAVRILLGIYSVGFLIGTHTHVKGIVAQGFLAQKAPLGFNLYWDSLTFFDPLTVLLLWTKPKLGISLAVGIMLTDIPVNAYTYASGYFGQPLPGMIPFWLLLQSVFATFIWTTAPGMMQKLQVLEK